MPDAARAPAAIADPAADIRSGIVVALLFFGLFVGWAAFVRLDAAAFAPGTLVVSGQRKAVQHRDGGVVDRIFVREGDRVVRDQLLVRLAAPEVQAQERALASQALRLLAQRARLQAEQLGEPRLRPPREFAALAARDRDEARLVLRLQQAELTARLATLAAQRETLAQRGAQSGQQARGFDEQRVSAREQVRSLDAQIEALRPLAERGFVSQTRVRELERLRAELRGRRGQFTASVAEALDAGRETLSRRIEAERSFRERTIGELREVETQLGEVLPKLRAAQEQLARTEIRAPATGAIVGLSVFTPGGVIAAGARLMDIVPERTPLRIQARFALDDADDLSVGQRVLVRFPSLHERDLPTLEGRLTRLSADSLTDEKSGQSYFTGEVTIPTSEWRRTEAQRVIVSRLRAGLPAELLVPLRKRTALDYAFEPLLHSFWSAFREH